MRISAKRSGYVKHTLSIRFSISINNNASFEHLQKARLARIRIAKASSGAAFVNKKKAAEARWAAQESGIELDDNYRDEDIFELQHHHLLRCLEKTTVRILNALAIFCLQDLQGKRTSFGFSSSFVFLIIFYVVLLPFDLHVDLSDIFVSFLCVFSFRQM